MAEKITIFVKSPTIKATVISKKISVSVKAAQGGKGQDGEDGITPIISSNSTSLTVSTDEGVSFNELVSFQSIIDGTNVSNLLLDKANLSGGNTFTGNQTISGNLAVDTNTLFVDSVNNKVGVGTTSPTAKLDVNGTLNVAGASTFLGKVTASNQGALSALGNNDVLTKFLLPSVLSKTATIQFANSFFFHTGTGGVYNSNQGTLFLKTGTTPNSRAAFNNGGNTALINPAAFDGDSITGINFSIKQRVAIRFAVSASAGEMVRFFWGSPFNGVYSGDATGKCVGLKVDSGNLKLFVHNGSTYNESASLLVMPANISHTIEIVADGSGNCHLFNNGSILGSLTGAPTGVTFAPVYSAFSGTVYNVDVSTDCRAIIGQLLLTTG